MVDCIIYNDTRLSKEFLLTCAIYFIIKIFVILHHTENKEFYVDSNKIHFVVYYIDEMLLKYYETSLF